MWGFYSFTYGLFVKCMFGHTVFHFQAKYEPGNPKCLMDGLFDHQRKLDESDAEHKLSDSDIYGINFSMILAGM